MEAAAHRPWSHKAVKQNRQANHCLFVCLFACLFVCLFVTNQPNRMKKCSLTGECELCVCLCAAALVSFSVCGVCLFVMFVCFVCWLCLFVMLFDCLLACLLD